MKEYGLDLWVHFDHRPPHRSKRSVIVEAFERAGEALAAEVVADTDLPPTVIVLARVVPAPKPKEEQPKPETTTPTEAEP